MELLIYPVIFLVAKQLELKRLQRNARSNGNQENG
jgi:hypothetical protein